MEKDRVSRREELLQLFEDGPQLLDPLISEAVYLEEQLDYLRDLPKIRVNPKDPSMQKATPAAKLYKEYLQQYVNVMKVLLNKTTEEGESEDSPLREWFRAHADQ